MARRIEEGGQKRAGQNTSLSVFTRFFTLCNSVHPVKKEPKTRTGVC